MNAPSKIWIARAGAEAPDWVLERMTTAEVAPDGSFEMEASDGRLRAEAGFAVFMFNDHVYACPPRLVQEKLAAAVGDDNEVVADLAERTEAMRERKQASKAAARKAPLAKAIGDRPLNIKPVIGDRPLNIKPVIGDPPAPQFAGVDNLLVDDSYQRSIEGGASQKMIVKIAENWDWRLCLPLLVSRRNGELFVIDGQHRLEAARLRGDIPHMPVVVFDFDDPRAEAELFVQANRSRRQMSKLDDFHAAAAAGDPKAVAVSELVTGAGLIVGRNQAWQMVKPGEVIFIGAIQRALRTFGDAVVRSVLQIMSGAFEGQVLTTGGAVFDSLCALTAERTREDRPIDIGLMITVLGEVGMAGWKDEVSGASNGFERADLMLDAIRRAYAEAEGEE